MKILLIELGQVLGGLPSRPHESRPIVVPVQIRVRVRVRVRSCFEHSVDVGIAIQR